MNAAVASISAANGIRSLNDLKRIWSNCGGFTVTTFDFVLQLAPRSSSKKMASRRLNLCR